MSKYLQVMKETETETSSVSPCSPANTTQATSLPIMAADHLAPTRCPKDQGKTTEVACTQTEGTPLLP